MLQSLLSDLMAQYRPLGMIKAGVLLLKPDDALRLAEDLEKLDVAIMGLDCWCYSDRDGRSTITQDAALSVEIDPKILNSDRAVQDSVMRVKRFISGELPPNAIFISLTLHIPYTWRLFADETH